MKTSFIYDDTTKTGKPYYHNDITIDTETGEGQSSVVFQGKTYKRSFTLVDPSTWEDVLSAFLYKSDRILEKLITWDNGDTAVGPAE